MNNVGINKMRRAMVALVAIALLAFAPACKRVNEGTTSVGNPVPPEVSFSALKDDGSVIIALPLAAFGEPEADLTGASLRIFKNGVEVVSNLSASGAYNSAQGNVQVGLGGLTSKDVLSVLTSKKIDYTYSSTVKPNINTDRFAVDCPTTSNGAEKLACALCERVVTCGNTIHQSECMNLLISANCTSSSCGLMVADQFGVPVPKNSISMEGMVEGSEAKLFSADSSKLNTCLSAISALSCSAVVPSGYDPATPNSLANLATVVPGNGASPCGDVYGN